MYYNRVVTLQPVKAVLVFFCVKEEYLPSPEFSVLSFCDSSTFSSLLCCIVSVLKTSVPSLSSPCELAVMVVVVFPVAPGLAELWELGREELPLLGPWTWLVLLLVVVVIVGVLGGFSTLC